MDEQLSKIKEQIKEIEQLKELHHWGPEFQLWKNKTKKLVKGVFGQEELELFQNQQTRSTSYIDKGYNMKQYHKELDNRRKILDGLLLDIEEHKSVAQENKTASKDILKEICL